MLVEGQPEEWRQALQEAIADGFTYLDLLSAIDREGGVELICHLVRLEDHRSRWVRAFAADPNPQAPTSIDLLPAASWPEREVREMFGVEFVGGSSVPLLLVDGGEGHPLRKSELLRARQERPWPGEAEPGGRRARRRHRPPGVAEPTDSVSGRRQ